MPLFCPVPPGTPAVPGRDPEAAAVGRPVLRRLAGARPDRARAQPELPRRAAAAAGPHRLPDRRRRRRGARARGQGRGRLRPLRLRPPRARSPWAGRATAPSARRSPAARRGDQRFFANPAPGLDMLALNTRRPLFRDVAMRRAVNVALDRPRARRGLGRAARPTATCPPAILPATGRSRYPLSGPDVAAARRLAAGRRGTATLYFCGEPGNRRVAEIVRANLRPIGIRVRITPSLACLRGHDPKRDTADIVLSRRARSTLDAAAFLALAGRRRREARRRGAAARLVGATRRSCAGSRAPTRCRRRSGTPAFAALQEQAARRARAAGRLRRASCGRSTSRRGSAAASSRARYRFLDLGAVCVRPA